MSEAKVPKPDFMTEADWAAFLESRTAEAIRAGGKEQVRNYLATKGEGADETMGGPTLLLTTIGRKTGKEATVPANYMQHGEDVIVVGSLAGLEHHPYWALNLEANPRAWVQIRERRWEVRARKVDAEERARLWPILTNHFFFWGHFQKYSEREFKVFVLSPA